LKRIVEPTSAFTVNRRGYYLALKIHIGLAQKADLDMVAPLVSQLDLAHCQVRALCLQDFEAYALFLGLRYIGQFERGAARLREYFNEQRRVRWPLPQPIRDALCSSYGSAETETGLK